MGSVSDGALKAASSEMENVAPLSAPFGGFCPQLCPAASADFRPRPCASPGRVRSETRDIPPFPEEGLSANPRCRDVRPFPAPGTDPVSPRRLAVHPMAERNDAATANEDEDGQSAEFLRGRTDAGGRAGNTKYYQILDIAKIEHLPAGAIGRRRGRLRNRGSGPRWRRPGGCGNSSLEKRGRNAI